ncbi:laminin subunit beta-4-like protein [Lates japonicus]|uniref:Laminin subunit beta-4-like protein n=1 Tax=Lates japonicus TaxID=270547 RepID=A0AAD3NF24_LATJO|nr:laminin subunit beta-4-like protein [Lates japonicus]
MALSQGQITLTPTFDQITLACDCNLEGTERPSCDPETGECICRTGVTGIFCDECAVGYSSEFPACKECHPCTTLWTENVTDVQRAAQRMRTFIPRHGDNLRPGDSHHRQRMLEMHSRLDSLTNLTGLSLPKVEKVEKLCMKIGKLKDAIDPNTILIDLSPLLNTEIDNIGLEFKKLLNNLKEKLIKDPDDEDEGDLEGLENVTIQLNLEAEFHFTHLIMTFKVPVGPDYRYSLKPFQAFKDMLKITNSMGEVHKLHTLGDNLLDSQMGLKKNITTYLRHGGPRNCFCYGHAF